MSQLNKYKRYTVTSALPYANGPLHIGHLAGAYLPADIFVRHLRLKKKDVFTSAAQMSMARPSLSRQKKKIPRRRLSLINTTPRLNKALRILG
jgi:hypothetical protein